MAQKKTTSNSKSTSTRSSGSSKKTTVSSRASSKNLPPEPEKEPILSVIWSYSWGKILYLIVGILLLVGIDLLFSMDNYDRFFIILGIEIIASMLIGWLVYFLLDRKKQREAVFGSDPSEEV